MGIWSFELLESAVNFASITLLKDTLKINRDGHDPKSLFLGSAGSELTWTTLINNTRQLNSENLALYLKRLDEKKN